MIDRTSGQVLNSLHPFQLFGTISSGHVISFSLSLSFSSVENTAASWGSSPKMRLPEQFLIFVQPHTMFHFVASGSKAPSPLNG